MAENVWGWKGWHFLHISGKNGLVGKELVDSVEFEIKKVIYNGDIFSDDISSITQRKALKITSYLQVSAGFMQRLPIP
ncbi:hypothetical protein LXL04_026155 [Taraxacum kok-saghyz]